MEYIRKKMGSMTVLRVNMAPAIGCLKWEHPVRQLLVKQVICSNWFDAFILFVIGLNCVFLAMNGSFPTMELIFLLIFTVETVLKMMALGICRGKLTYLHDAWNWLDFLVVVLGWVGMLPGVGNFSAIRAIRVFRALRAMKAVPSLRQMVNSLILCVGALGDIMTLLTFYVLFIATVGLQLYMGVMRQGCTKVPAGVVTHQAWNDYVRNSSNWVDSLGGGESGGRFCGNASGSTPCPASSGGLNVVCLPTRENPNGGYTNYDSFSYAMLAAFQLTTLDFWEDQLMILLHTVGPQCVPFFLIGVIFGGFFLINLVLAVVVTAYDKIAEDRDTAAEESNAAADRRDADLVAKAKAMGLPEPDLITKRQKTKSSGIDNRPVDEVAAESIEADKARKKARRDRITGSGRWSRFRRSCLEVSETRWFTGTVVALIILNTITMAMEYPAMPSALKSFCDISNIFFIAAFTLEMLVKMAGLGFREDGYFKSGWNRFDFTIVFLSIVELILTYASSTQIGGLSVLRTFRLLRVMKLAQSWSTMQKLVTTIMKAMSELGALTFILLIVMYTFAVLGKELFGEKYTTAAFAAAHPDWGGEVPIWNFTDFAHSFLQVFRILVGEWIEPLWETMAVVGPGSFLWYFITLIVGNFVIMNLFLALLLGAFEGTTSDDDALKPLDPDHAAKMASEYDTFEETLGGC